MIKVRMFEKGIVWVEAEVSGDAFTEENKIRAALLTACEIKRQQDGPVEPADPDLEAMVNELQPKAEKLIATLEKLDAAERKIGDKQKLIEQMAVLLEMADCPTPQVVGNCSWCDGRKAALDEVKKSPAGLSNKPDAGDSGPKGGLRD